MSHHVVKRHVWINGMLSIFEHAFGSFEDAKAFADSCEADTVKIHDDQGQMIHSGTPVAQDSYA